MTAKPFFRRMVAEVNGKVWTFMVFLSYVLLGVDFLTFSPFSSDFHSSLLVSFFPASSLTAEAASDAYKLDKLRWNLFLHSYHLPDWFERDSWVFIWFWGCGLIDSVVKLIMYMFGWFNEVSIVLMWCFILDAFELWMGSWKFVFYPCLACMISRDVVLKFLIWLGS